MRNLIWVMALAGAVFAQSSTVAEYATLEETFSPKALAVMGDWLAKQALK